MSEFKKLQKYNFWNGIKRSFGFPREGYQRKLEKLNKTKTIITVTGGRRVGKSFVVRQFIKNLITNHGVQPSSIFYANLFIRELSFLKNPDRFVEILQQYKKRLSVDESKRIYIIIDEVQEIEKWQLLVNSLYEDYTADYKLIITGSNAKLLSGELATYLAGRSYELTVYPLSFSEFTLFKEMQKNRHSFLEYMKQGGMPEVILAEDKFARNNLIEQTIESVIMRDIILKHAVRNVLLLKKLVDFFIHSPSDEISRNRVMNILKSDGETVSINTVMTYIEYLKDSFLIHECALFSYKKSDILRNGLMKTYLNDISFANMSESFRDVGKILENMVYIELLRRGYSVYTLKVKEKEVDFVATKGDEKIYLQVAYTFGEEDSSTFEREFGNLTMIEDHYEKAVITLDALQHTPVNGVKHIMAEEWF